MKTIVKYAIVIITTLVLMSCKTDFNFTGVKGNRDVTTTTRVNGKSFSSIKASEGLEVVLTQSNNTLVKVQADSNLQDLIITEIIDGVLILHTEEQIGNAAAKKIMVHFTTLEGLKTSSGADVHNTKTIQTKNLKISTSSGSTITLNVNIANLTCKSSSGANINLAGNTNSFTATASSGSVIDADKLIAKQCDAKASSGANIDINCVEKIEVSASSGANIDYYGNPTQVNKNKSSGGSVSNSSK